MERWHRFELSRLRENPGRASWPRPQVMRIIPRLAHGYLMPGGTPGETRGGLSGRAAVRGIVTMSLLYVGKVFCCFVLLLCLFDGGVVGQCDVTRCTDPNRCVLAYNKITCKCVTGYYGDLCDKAVKMNVVCGKDFITIMVQDDFFKYHNIGVESLHLQNESCRAQQEVIGNVSYYLVRTYKDQYVACGGNPLEANITHVSYSLTLMSDPQGYQNIVREPVVKISYSCVYPYVRSVSLPFPIIPASSETFMRVEDLDAKVEMSLFKDATYSEAFSSFPTFQLNDKVYVQVSVTQPEDIFSLIVKDCWGSQSAEHNQTAGLMYSLLEEGCVSDHTVMFLNETGEDEQVNGRNSTVRYSFDMFRFVTEPYDLYLHCNVFLCTPDDAELCIPKCSGITKREAGEPTQGLLSYGPIRIDEPANHKSNGIMVLLLPVGTVWVLGIFLLILISMAKAGNRRQSFPFQNRD
ncbi:zona pellucida glycoprotein d isoform X2 [Denticeps clupeoides]|uniref:zona pellucida glycoprotein d isoform X2 n=1 Tax=Denticeps clupeoides TaxID=299321 RepID=UPI0010A33459|nr:uromodulin-like isoform X2 [Denticeps clupeoides]